MKTESRLFWFDFTRAICALTVFLGHLRAVVFVDYGSIPEKKDIFQKLFYYITGFGNQAVIVFFILSGFFVGGSILNSTKKFNWIQYLIVRLTRLWIVLVPSLIFTLFIDCITNAVNPRTLSGEYRNLWHSGPPPGEYSNSAKTFIGNVFFLQTICLPVYGSNRPLWSLSNEFWYYIMFPLLAVPFFRPNNMSTYSIPISLTIGVLIYYLIPSGMKTGFFIWALGAFLPYFQGKLNKKKIYFFLTMGLTSFLIILTYSRKTENISSLKIPMDALIGIAFFITSIGLINLNPKIALNKKVISLVEFISESSYTLYLFHFPLVILMGSLLFSNTKLAPNPQGFFQFLILSLTIYGICMVFYFAFEKNTNYLRKKISSAFYRRDYPSTKN